MNIGKLNKRISLITVSNTTDGAGFKSEETRTVLRTIWADVRKNKRRAITEEEKESIENTLLFDVRYQDVPDTCLINFQNKEYEILTIEDIEFNKTMLTITAREVK